MNTNPAPGSDEAQEILEALRKIQDSDQLRAEAAKNPQSVLNRLGVSGIARHAVAFGIAGLFVGQGMMRPMSWWSN